MSIEAARTDYLYVVDQEQYADGSKGEPYLIFPTNRTLGGDNSVKAGRWPTGRDSRGRSRKEQGQTAPAQ